ncbi:2787_t:CDS:2 [Rhizophagus irregularis]|nr:2787_t:CDS:2 [Rhizophagus irregularis]
MPDPRTIRKITDEMIQESIHGFKDPGLPKNVKEFEEWYQNV